MLVSRKNIPTDSIIKSDFIKLNPVKYFELLEVEPNAPQIAIINALSKYRFVCAALSRRTGKTYVANIIGQLLALYPGKHILIISPNYKLSQISFDLQRQLIKRFGIEVLKDNNKDSVIELTNGSTIRMGSVNQVDSVVGRSYDLIIFDEAALTNAGEAAFNIALRPTLDKPNSRALFISTPRGRNNYFSRFYQRGFSDNYKEWASIHATYKDNPRAVLDDIEEARLSMSDAEFRQEYEADFTIYEGKIYNFDVECIREFDIKFDEVIAGLDVGYKDPTAFLVIGLKDDKYYVIDEYLSSENTTAQHAAAIKNLTKKYGIEMIYIDAAAAQFAADLAGEYDIETVRAKKSILDGINHVAALVDRDNLIVHPRCMHTIAALDGYQWDSSSSKEKPLHSKESHIADALRYAVYSHVTGSGVF